MISTTDKSCIWSPKRWTHLFRSFQIQEEDEEEELEFLPLDELEESESELESEPLFWLEFELEFLDECLSSILAFGLGLALRFGTVFAARLGATTAPLELPASSWSISTSVFTFEAGLSDAGMQAASITAGGGNDVGDTDRAMCSACVRQFRALLHHAFKQLITFLKFSGVSGLTLQDFLQPVLSFLAWNGQLACQT